MRSWPGRDCGELEGVISSLEGVAVTLPSLIIVIDEEDRAFMPPTLCLEKRIKISEKKKKCRSPIFDKHYDSTQISSKVTKS